MPVAAHPNGTPGAPGGGPYDDVVPRRSSPYTLRAAVRRQAVLVVALPVLAAILAIGMTGRAPLAGVLLAVELLALAAVRALLPTRVVGALAVRPRPIDVGVLGLLGIAILVLCGAPNL